MTHVELPRAHRIILRAYPRSFRERFGPEMAQLLLDRRRAGAHGVGLALREAVDCLRVAPRLHLEGPMYRIAIIGLISAVLAMTVIGGPVGVSAAVVLAVVLVVVLATHRDERPIGAADRQWWHWFVGGAAALAVTFVVLAIDGDELTSAGWVIAFISFNLAAVLALIGLASGAGRILQHARSGRA